MRLQDFDTRGLSIFRQLNLSRNECPKAWEVRRYAVRQTSAEGDLRCYLATRMPSVFSNEKQSTRLRNLECETRTG
jgi:hypothetical protein